MEIKKKRRSFKTCSVHKHYLIMKYGNRLKNYVVNDTWLITKMQSKYEKSALVGKILVPFLFLDIIQYKIKHVNDEVLI